MGKRITAGVLAVGLAGAMATPAAADRTVQAADASFEPSSVQITPGEAVTWTNPGGIHNVRFEDGQFEVPSTPSTMWPTPVRRVFGQVGTFRYYCEQHGGAGGVGMSGLVRVATAGTLPPPGPGTGTPGAVKIEGLRLTRRRFCNTRGPNCPRPGIRLRIRLSQAARVRGVLKRRRLDGEGRARRFGTVDFGTVATGRRTLRFRRTRTGRRLTPGRYSLTVKAGQDSKVLRFRVIS